VEQVVDSRLERRIATLDRRHGEVGQESLAIDDVA
jgi:hypothetical protein